MLNKNLSRPGRRFHPHSPQPPASWRPCSSGNPFVQSKALNKRLGFRPPRSARPGQASAPPRSTNASRRLPLAVRKEGTRREWRLARCRWSGGHPRRRRTCHAPWRPAASGPHACRSGVPGRPRATTSPCPLRHLHAPGGHHECRASAHVTLACMPCHGRRRARASSLWRRLLTSRRWTGVDRRPLGGGHGRNAASGF